MVVLLDPDRECHCVVCDGGDPAAEPADEREPGHDSAHECQDNTADLVRQHGWSVTGVHSEDGVPAWVYSIGLWHTLGSAEVAMFGLRMPDMQSWLNVIGERIRDGQPLNTDEPVLHGVLPGDYPLALRMAHPAWYPFYFGRGLRFYQFRPPLPFVQAIWPDREGRFPWDEDAGAACQANQPWLWLPPEDHPPGLWRNLESITPWPFQDTPVDTEVFTTKRIAAGEQPIRGVVRNQDGTWYFLDGPEITKEMIAVAHVHHVYAQHPHLAQFAGLAPGRQAWQSSDGTWVDSDLPKPANP